MIQPLLTIAIPTYNRASHLELLLNTLAHDLKNVDAPIEIIVSDNASIDSTPSVCHNFLLIHPSAIINRNIINVGAENNLLECFSRASGRYLWIIGDDDAPRPGALNIIAELLKTIIPDLVYLRSEWAQDISFIQRKPIETLKAVKISLTDFAVETNIWMTFISSVIINRNLFFEYYSLQDAKRFQGSNLLQLAWVLGVLKKGSKFIYVKDSYVFATSNNSGGYEIIKTFGVNFPKITQEIFSTDKNLAKAIVRRCLVTHTPEIIWQFRFENNKSYSQENSWGLLKETLKCYPEYWLILYPMICWPRPVSWAFLQLSYLIRGVIKQKTIYTLLRYKDIKLA